VDEGRDPRARFTLDKHNDYPIHSQWRDAASIQAMQRDPRMNAYFPRIAALASFESIVGDVAHAASAPTLASFLSTKSPTGATA
jgi:hypothetical protein